MSKSQLKTFNFFQDVHGNTAFKISIDLGRTEITEMILRHPGFNINGEHANGKTPLINAASRGKTRIVWLLVARTDLDINAREPKSGLTAVNLAVVNNHKECLKEGERRDLRKMSRLKKSP